MKKVVTSHRHERERERERERKIEKGEIE